MNVGDKVRIKKPTEDNCWWIKSMDKYDGMEGIITEVISSAPVHYKVSGAYGKNDKPYFFCKEGLEII